MINDVDNEIISAYRTKYEELLESDFEEFYFEMAPHLNNLNKIRVKELEIKKIKTNMKKTKGRWLKKVLTNKNSKVLKDIDSVKVVYEKVVNQELSQDKFSELFGSKDINEYVQIITSTLDDWKNDDEILLTEFKYIECVDKRAIRSAFKNDISLKYLIKYLEEENSKPLTKVPTILSDLPIDTTSRMDFLSDEQKKDLDEAGDIDSPSTIDKLIMFDQGAYDEILLQLQKKTYIEIKKGGKADKFLDMMTQIALLKSVKYLNSTDVDIIRYYYTHLEKMVLGEPIDKTIYQVVIDLGLPNRPQYYEQVENSLAKLGSMNLSYDLEGNSIHGNLLGCMIYEDEGVKRATVYLGPILQAVVLKKSTFEYDEATFNSLSSDSQQLAIWFQKRRYRSAINNQGYNDIIALGMFSTAIYWNTKRKDRQRDRILASLKELKEKNLIIKDFFYDKRIYQFTIEYIPLSPRELSKLEINNTSHNNVLKDANYKLLEEK